MGAPGGRSWPCRSGRLPRGEGGRGDAGLPVPATVPTSTTVSRTPRIQKRFMFCARRSPHVRQAAYRTCPVHSRTVPEKGNETLRAERSAAHGRWAVMAIVAFMTIPGLVLGLILFTAVDRMGLWANRRFRLPWRRDELGRPVSAIGLDHLDELFYATRRYELDQRRTSLILRDEESDGAPPNSKVDLDGGTAVIRRVADPDPT